MIKKILIATVLIVPFFSLITCDKKSGDWAVKIDDNVVTIDEFYNYYYIQNKILLNVTKAEIDKMSADPSMANHPTINKSKFMEFIITRKLLYTKARNDSSINEEELNTIVELYKLNGVAMYYLSEKLKNDITVTEDEIDRFYTENRRLFKGVPIDDSVINKVKQQIFLQKFEKKSNEFLMNLIAESKVNKEGFKKHLREKAEAAMNTPAPTENNDKKNDAPKGK